MLSNHDDKRKVIHPKGCIEQLVCIYEEYDVLDGIFNDAGVNSV